MVNDSISVAARDLGVIVMKPMCGREFRDAELAFRFLSGAPRLVPIPGIETTAEIEEIVRVVEERRGLEGDARRRAEETARRLGTAFCRRCGYCRPCPEGIPVTAAMTFAGLRKRMPEEKLRNDFAPKLARTLPNCTECGTCEEACPYDLPTIERIRAVRQEVKELVRTA